MIIKVDQIKNVGRFANFSGGSNDDLAFKKNTLIFGKNTHGKSTFTAILRSLGESDNDQIVGRKTLDKQGDQIVILKNDSNNIIFRNKWKVCLFIRIFDSKYVQKNIYTNDCPDTRKQENIISIILGKKGIALELEYNKVRSKLDENTNKKRDITNLYNKTFDSRLISFPNFQKLINNPDIELEIQKNNSELEAIKNQQQIKNILSNLANELEYIGKFDSTCLYKTLEIKEDKIKQHVLENINDQNKALKFLNDGFLLLKNKEGDRKRKCVFCGQELSEGAELLIATLNSLFSIEYNDLNKNIKNNLYILNSWNIEQKILSSQSQLQKYGVSLELTDLSKEINILIKQLTSAIETKQSNLNIIVKDDDLKLLFQKIEDVKQKTKPFFDKYQTAVASSETDRLIKEKHLLEMTKQRFTKSWVDLCNEYQDLVDDYSNNIKPQEEYYFNQKKDYAETVFTEYESVINNILSKLKAGFELSDLKVPQNRRSASRLFNIKFNGCNSPVPIEGEESVPNFKNTLSDSDRRILAFAFFIAEIEKSVNLSQEIVVFDDPTSSLDRERCLLITKILRDLKNLSGKSPNQLIILTHDDNFFKVADKLITDDKRTLKIEWSQSLGTSRILPCDVYEEFIKEEYFLILDKIKKYYDGSISTIHFENIRKILENIIYKKYYFIIPDERRAKGGTLSWYLEQQCISQDIKDNINDLFPSMSHHDQTNSISENDLGEEDKKAIIENFINILPMI